MVKMKAKIYLKTSEEGGLTRPGFSGMQPSFAVEGDLIICKVSRSDGRKEMPLGNEYMVDIELPYGEKFASSLAKNHAVCLHIGSRVIAEGVIIA